MSETKYRCLHCMKPASATESQRDLSIQEQETQYGTTIPLGVSWIVSEQSWNFALYSDHAERVTLLLYSADNFTEPVLAFDFDRLRNRSGVVWHCRIRRSECPAAHYYAYRVGGPSDESRFDINAFDNQKILIDPYALSILFPPEFDREAARTPGSNAGRTPLGLLNACRCPGREPRTERLHHADDLIIYEMHVKGFTRNTNSGVPANKRGTFSGVVEKIPYLQSLGITAVELMPVFQFDPGDGNYWGYMPLNFFSPHQSYSANGDSCRQHTEFREMVDALHEAGVEVILDVVYNHTCEGDQLGPTYSYKGIDNETYYILCGDSENPYCNFSGTGNTLRTTHRAVRDLILDSLRYWVTEMGVDGFRFDLASIFTRSSDGSIDLNSPIFAEMAEDPVLAGTRFIAEPWDAAGAYQLGQTFPGTGWQQWNGRYRDTLQRFVRGDDGMVPDLMTRIYGSSDLFSDERTPAFRPFQSVNFITSHDGFTLNDLVSFNDRRNEANGHGNTDGHGDFSWNCGWEGDEKTPENVGPFRKQQVRNFFCLLMLSNGTPMFRMGDEFLQTQGGNNNPYNQDSEVSWLNWDRLSKNYDVFRFVQDMIAFRKSHRAIAPSRFWRDDVRWFGPDGTVDMSETSHTLAYFLPRISRDDEDIYVLINAGAEATNFKIQHGVAGEWLRRIDTSIAKPTAPINSDVMRDLKCKVGARSVVVLTRTK